MLLAPSSISRNSKFSANIGRAKVLLCSNEAERQNIQPGMTFTEARAICSQINWREYDDKLYKSAQKKLARELIAASPRVSSAEPGIFLFDAQGFNRLGGENKLCRDVLKLASRHGFVDGHIGLGDCAFAARVASCSKKRWFIIPPCGDKAFLSPLSIDFLPVSAEAKGNFRELGIKTIGQFVSVPFSAYNGRFDKDVLTAYELASGRDPSQPSLPALEKVYKCTIDIGSATESLKETLFILKTMLDRLTYELELNGLVAEELTISFFNDEDKFDERVIKLIRPSKTSRFLLDVLRLSLESKALIREFTAIELAVSRFGKEAFEQTRATINARSGEELLLPGDDNDDSSESVMLLMQRFMTRLGEDSLVRPVLNDQYLPETSGVWMPVMKVEAHSPTPVNESMVNRFSTRKDSLMPGLVLKRHDPALPVFVQFKEEDNNGEPKPSAITYRGQWYHINKITMPERISGMWWEKPVRKSYYVALIEKRELALSRSGQRSGIRSILPTFITVLLVYDHEERAWLVEGVFD